jgi:hypothetical protein
MSMKSIFLFAAVLGLLSISSCHKDNNNGECVFAAITKVMFNKCGGFEDTAWGVKINGLTYPQDLYDSIPAEFQHEGLTVCIQYKTISYPFACPCCYDGPYIQIISIKKAE